MKFESLKGHLETRLDKLEGTVPTDEDVQAILALKAIDDLSPKKPQPRWIPVTLALGTVVAVGLLMSTVSSTDIELQGQTDIFVATP
ncbi:MAG: hypothetical protein AAFY15_15905, partial [Cyanobacteria bacterium J06648_11]